MKVVFLGTPAFAVPSLTAMAAAGFEIVTVVTQPDRPRGRGQKTTPSDVKSAALNLGLEVWQPEKLRTDEATARMKAIGADIGVVAAYGKILPAALLAAPRLGMINVHASLLPRWRGAAPIHRAIMAGDEETGVTIMRVVEALDAGPMLAKLPTAIDKNETSEALELRLADDGARLLVKTLHAIARGPVVETAQDEALVTYAKRLERRESALDWSAQAASVHNHIRGLQPWPVASAILNGRRVLLRKSVALATELHSASPGTVLRIEPDSLIVGTGAGAIRLLDVQVEGRAAMPMSAYLAGHAVKPGDRFEQWTPA